MRFVKNGVARATRTLGPLGRAPRAGSRRYVEVQKGKVKLRREKVSSGLRKFTDGLLRRRKTCAKRKATSSGQGKEEGLDHERVGLNPGLRKFTDVAYGAGGTCAKRLPRSQQPITKGKGQ